GSWHPSRQPADRQRIVSPGRCFWRHRITPLNVSGDRHLRRRLVSVRACTARPEHRRGKLAETDGGAEPGMFGHNFAGFAEKPLAPVGCPREPTEDGERASRRRELASLPPPTEAMRCRSEATKPKRCAVGQTVTMRCRFATTLP